MTKIIKCINRFFRQRLDLAEGAGLKNTWTMPTGKRESVELDVLALAVSRQ